MSVNDVEKREEDLFDLIVHIFREIVHRDRLIVMERIIIHQVLRREREREKGEEMLR